MHNTDIHPVVAGHDRHSTIKGGKGIITCRKEWRVQLIAYIEGSPHQGKRKGATSRQWRSCAKRGERLEREDNKMELTWYFISPTRCACLAENFPIDTWTP